MKKIVNSMALLTVASSLVIAGGDFSEALEPVVNIPEQEIVVIEDEVKYDGFYVGAGLGNMRMSENITLNGVALTLMAGYYFNQYVGVEARYSQTINDLDIDSARPVLSVEDELSNVGLYVKPMYALTTGFSLYGLAGYGWSTYETSVKTYEEDGFQWGLGAKYELANGVGLFIDYLDIYDDDNYDEIMTQDVSMNSVTVGAAYTF